MGAIRDRNTRTGTDPLVLTLQADGEEAQGLEEGIA
jgi:hypothetical protein